MGNHISFLILIIFVFPIHYKNNYFLKKNMIRYFFIFTLLLVSSINAQKPGRVRQLSFSDITTDSITASWKIPADSGDSPLAGFRVAYTIKDQNDWKKSSWITSRSYQFVNLQAGTTYSFAVQAKNQNGKLSSWRIGEETTSPVSNPSIPRNLNLDNAESMVLSINWNLPSDNGGSVVNRCRVRHKNTSADSTDYVFTAWMAATSYMIMDLSPNTDYHVGVQCRNKDGLKSPWLTEMFSTIIDAPSLVSINLLLLFFFLFFFLFISFYFIIFFHIAKRSCSNG